MKFVSKGDAPLGGSQITLRNTKSYQPGNDRYSLSVGARADTENRAVILGEYIIEHNATVRAAAKEFGISKSTVHTVVAK